MPNDKPEELESTADHAGQMSLLDADPEWKKQWEGMPEFKQEDLEAVKSLTVNFETWDDMKAFAKLVEQTITSQTRSIWYPEADIGRIVNKRYVDKS